MPRLKWRGGSRVVEWNPLPCGPCQLAQLGYWGSWAGSPGEGAHSTPLTPSSSDWACLAHAAATVKRPGQSRGGGEGREDGRMEPPLLGNLDQLPLQYPSQGSWRGPWAEGLFSTLPAPAQAGHSSPAVATPFSPSPLPAPPLHEKLTLQGTQVS